MKTRKINKDTISIFLGTSIVIGITILSSVALSSSNVFADNDNVVDEINITVPVSCTFSGTGQNSHSAEINNGVYTDNIGTINFETYQYLPDYTPGMHFSIKRVKGILHCNGVPVKNNRPYHTRQFTKNRISLDLKTRDKWNKTHHNKDDQQSTQIHQPYWCIRIFKDKVTVNSDFLRFMMYSVPKKERKIGTWDVIGDCVICYYKSSDCNDCRTIKALARRIRKWKLPVGTELKVYQLRYPDDD